MGKKIESKPSVSKTVEIRRITNGYIVGRWGPKGQVEQFAKTKAEAKKKAEGML